MPESRASLAVLRIKSPTDATSQSKTARGGASSGGVGSTFSTPRTGGRPSASSASGCWAASPWEAGFAVAGSGTAVAWSPSASTEVCRRHWGRALPERCRPDGYWPGPGRHPLRRPEVAGFGGPLPEALGPAPRPPGEGFVPALWSSQLTRKWALMLRGREEPPKPAGLQQLMAPKPPEG